MLAGSRSLAAIAEWGKDVPRAWPRLGIVRVAPSRSTIRRVLLLVDPDVLDAALHAWLATVIAPVTPPTPSGLVPTAFTAVAVDGRACRGARTGDGGRVHPPMNRFPAEAGYRRQVSGPRASRARASR